MFVYDYVIYNGEPIIEFRLKYLNNYVDRFIIVESIYTHSGIKKTIFILILIKIYLNLIHGLMRYINEIIFKKYLINNTVIFLHVV